VKEEYKKYLKNGVINEDNAVDIIDAQQEEIERLNNIIKEVREYIKNMKIFDWEEEYDIEKLLEILDKGGK